MVYVCKDLLINKREYFVENLDGFIQETTDKTTIEKIKQLFIAKSEDVIYPKN